MFKAAQFCLRIHRRSSVDHNISKGLGLRQRCQFRCYDASARYKKKSMTGDYMPMTNSSYSSTSRTSATMRYVIPATVFLGFAGIVAYLRYNDERRAVLKGQDKSREGIPVKGPVIGGPFSLVDTKSQIFTEHNLLGNWVLLYFGYTSSPDVGPAEVQKIAEVVGILESEQNVKILPIFVTIDPLRDSPSQLRTYLRDFDSRIVGLTGSVAAIRQMAQAYRVFFKKVEEDGNDYLIESSHIMYLMNPNMEIVRCFGVEYNSKELVGAIVNELERAS
ncbi:hypothetical protein Dimus_017929 [Dionaea muscipula]